MSKQNQKSLKLEILEKLSSLITAGFGLVAALAWNEVIQDFFATIFPKPNMLLGKFIYAVIITLIIVIITVKLGNIISKLKEAISEEEKNEPR
ncbi:MAG: DUF5654 family protein [Patescibacteria group bacterium]|nr:DUF5654 family protein [Patescibacteria group bacterium]MDD5164202.1 DUF5654 family protein [Patescibacteria group bacterium]MDD5534620.1 DUF5654 family protein [Patescibacteria group bacterium]